MITVYGIKTCTTVRKAMDWLADHGQQARFHDYRANGLPPERLDRFIAALGWEAMLNRSGTTWRELPDAEKTAINAAKARALMLAHPAIIKRPLFELPGGVLVLGFGPQEQQRLHAAQSGA